MARKQLALFGTEFEELEDEQKQSVSKKPLSIENQIATDEKGRRRFHGAFTGGFSAGFFNTVGTKQGWVPQQFKSSRDDRAQKQEIGPEDIMDEEDLGEFGIAPRSIKLRRDFLGELGLTEPGQKHRLAWEHDSGTSALSQEASRLADLIKPVSDSMGIRLLKRMGWRPGQGIGVKQSRRLLERQRVNEFREVDSKTALVTDESLVNDVETMAPGFRFAPDDVDPHYFTSKGDTHGLGYGGISRDSGVLEQNYGKRTAILKTDHKSSRGIHGQAFGVGAFEAEDDDIYSRDDITQYDFALGQSASSYQEQQSDWTSEFRKAERAQPPRKIYAAPKLPKDWTANHRPLKAVTSLEQLPVFVRNALQRLTPADRARFFADRREQECVRKSRWDKTCADNNHPSQEDAAPQAPLQLPFGDNLDKQKRFETYVQYLKRGLNMPTPAQMTEWEWEGEVCSFQSHLRPELRAVLPEVKARQKPLAKPAIAANFAHFLKSKFTQAALTDDNDPTKTGQNDEDKLHAVRLKMFGRVTREQHEWHPEKNLVKRFNIPDPYPHSTVTGVPHFQKEDKKDFIYDMALFPDTSQELANRKADIGNVKSADDTPVSKNTVSLLQSEVVGSATSQEVEDNRLPMDLFKAIFLSDAEDDVGLEETDSETEKEPVLNASNQECPSFTGVKSEMETVPVPDKKPDSEKVLTVMDLFPKEVKSDDQEEYGPVLPPPTHSPALPTATFSVVARHREKHKNRRSVRRRREKKKNAKERSVHKKKRKKTRQRSKDRNSRSSWTSSSRSSTEDDESDSDVKIIDQIL